jgi:hypothetical protein
MQNAPASNSDANAPPPETRAERRMRRLEAMSEMGVSLGRKLERQAELAAAYAETDAVPDNLPHSRRLDEIARAFAQVCRAVAITTALEDRIDNGLPALPDLDRARRLRNQAAADKRAEAARAVERTFDADPAVASRKHTVRLRLDLHRLLDAECLDLDRFLDRPLPGIVADLRRNLGLDPIDEEEALWRDARREWQRTASVQEVKSAPTADRKDEPPHEVDADEASPPSSLPRPRRTPRSAGRSSLSKKRLARNYAPP